MSASPRNRGFPPVFVGDESPPPNEKLFEEVGVSPRWRTILITLSFHANRIMTLLTNGLCYLLLPSHHEERARFFGVGLGVLRTPSWPRA